jgi:hypothetical protein
VTVSRGLPAVAFATLLAMANLACEAKDYVVKLSRPDKVGLKYRLEARETKKQSMAIHKGAAELKKEESRTTVILHAVVEVLKVTAKGEPLEKKVTIEKFVDAKDEPLLKKGDVVTAKTVAGKTVYRMEKRDLDGRAAEFLGDLVKTKTTSSADDDAVFGSKTPRKVGESWKIDAKPLAKDLKLKPENIGGTVTLEAVEKHAGQNCLRIAIDLKMDAVPPGAKLAMNGFKAKSADVRMKIGGLVPVDPKRHSPGEWMRAITKAEWVGDTPARKDVSIRLHIDVTMNATMRYLD